MCSTRYSLVLLTVCFTAGAFGQGVLTPRTQEASAVLETEHEDKKITFPYPGNNGQSTTVCIEIRNTPLNTNGPVQVCGPQVGNKPFAGYPLSGYPTYFSGAPQLIPVTKETPLTEQVAQYQQIQQQPILVDRRPVIQEQPILVQQLPQTYKPTASYQPGLLYQKQYYYTRPCLVPEIGIPQSTCRYNSPSYTNANVAYKVRPSDQYTYVYTPTETPKMGTNNFVTGKAREQQMQGKTPTVGFNFFGQELDQQQQAFNPYPTYPSMQQTEPNPEDMMRATENAESMKMDTQKRIEENHKRLSELQAQIAALEESDMEPKSKARNVAPNILDTPLSVPGMPSQPITSPSIGSKPQPTAGGSPSLPTNRQTVTGKHK